VVTVPNLDVEHQHRRRRAGAPAEGAAGAGAGPGRPKAGSSLDRATHSGERPLPSGPGLIIRESKPPVAVCIRKDALEASVVLVGTPKERDPDHVPEHDPERSAKEADRRARAEMRRYCVANRLNKLWSLTYAEEPDDWATVWEHVEAFRKRLWAHLGRRIPMVVVIEEGSRNGRLHVHLAVHEWLDWADVVNLWGHGYCFVQKIEAKKNERTTLSASDQARIVASYLSGYLIANAKKAHAQDGRSAHGKRFSTTRGFSPGCERVRVETLDQALSLVYRTMGPTPSYLWSSSTLDEWDGPPVWVAFW
jgi:hypothetical protein